MPVLPEIKGDAVDLVRCRLLFTDRIDWALRHPCQQQPPLAASPVPRPLQDRPSLTQTRQPPPQSQPHPPTAPHQYCEYRAWKLEWIQHVNPQSTLPKRVSSGFPRPARMSAPQLPACQSPHWCSRWVQHEWAEVRSPATVSAAQDAWSSGSPRSAAVIGVGESSMELVTSSSTEPWRGSLSMWPARARPPRHTYTYSATLGPKVEEPDSTGGEGRCGQLPQRGD